MLRDTSYDNTAEGCIEILSGIHPTINYAGREVDYSDKGLLLSLARQSFRGRGYTDRQYDLVKSKIELYRNTLETLVGINVDDAINNLRLPLRSIDRSRWIKIESVDDTDYIAVRFSFNKKLIAVIDSLRTKRENKNLYNEEKKIHYFPLTELNIFNIVNLLKDKGFTIDKELAEKYEIIEIMVNNKNNYIPGVYGFKLENLDSKAIEYVISDIGSEPDSNNLALYNDRKHLYGLYHFDEVDLNQSISKLTTLSQKIVKRQDTCVLVNDNNFTINQVAETVLELNRYPLLVCLQPHNELQDLKLVHDAFRNIFLEDDFCVMYRRDNDKDVNIEFNNYIREHSLNNPLDISSKIVYTTQEKFVKTLLKSDWRPKSALVFGCNRANKMDHYLNEIDLVMYYDSDVSPFLKRVEKI